MRGKNMGTTGVLSPARINNEGEESRAAEKE